MSSQRDGRVKALFAGFVLSLFALVGLVAFGLAAGVSALATPTAGVPLVLALLDAIVPYLAGAVVVALLSVVLLVSLVVSMIRRASLPRSERLARVARGVERVSPQAREKGLAERFEPTTEERIADLKREYVADEIGELEYERRLEDLLDERRGSDEHGVRDERPRRSSRTLDPEFER
ncbi:SHOCT domain-containing protein [Halorussus amylolyticus]|uniref:SHOCT domain-containing protein n=1 Tax=Halorussus amylolyticus TaxID=1126242 RepID=UPI0010477722|nr:SHOCT domain-containing protein [Halorussus amylolyticus]